MKLKLVMRLDRRERKLRLFRLLWQRGTVGDGDGYSAKLSFALVPKLFEYRLELFGWRTTLFGVHVHHRKSYGGIFV